MKETIFIFIGVIIGIALSLSIPLVFAQNEDTLSSNLSQMEVLVKEKRFKVSIGSQLNQPRNDEAFAVDNVKISIK